MLINDKIFVSINDYVWNSNLRKYIILRVWQVGMVKISVRFVHLHLLPGAPEGVSAALTKNVTKVYWYYNYY